MNIPGNHSTVRTFRRHLLHWYDRNKRDLPWRRTSDPYRIWLSEVMLQQTRVVAVISHYERFLERFPTVECLANADSSAVLAVWSGLGYYRRARAIHAAATKIVQEHASQFPADAAALQQLPGIGRYTAAAISSIAFNQPVAVVDGNIERVLKRVTGRHRATRKEIWNHAAELLYRNRPGDFNQALMELGATVCLPKPQCSQCPVSRWCRMRGSETKGVRQRRRRAHSFYRLVKRADKILLVRRETDASLMPGMWELPRARGASGSARSFKLRHSITVTDFEVTVNIGGGSVAGVSGCWIPVEDLNSIPLTGLTRKILRHANFI